MGEIILFSENMTHNNDPDFIKFAHKMADVAGEIARQYFRTPFDVEQKSDDSPVTIADRMIEQRLREMIEAQRPQDGILGEEFGHKPTGNGLTWVLDPIDGTKSFTVGRPTFGTLIGLCEDTKPVLGLIDQPVLHERWLGVTGGSACERGCERGAASKAFFNGKPIHTRPCAELKQAVFGTGSPSQISRDDHARFDRLDRAARYTVYQGDCYFYGLLANGSLDLIIEDQLGLYDFIALVPIIEGAGGIITDWRGRPKTLDGDPSVIAAGDEGVYSTAKDLL